MPCAPSSWLVAGCWKYRQGGDWRVGDSRRPRLVPQPSKGQECAVHCASRISREKEEATQAGLFTGLWIVLVTVPQFPQTEKGVYWPLPRRRRGELRRRVLMLQQECGKQRVLRAAS